MSYRIPRLVVILPLLLCAALPAGEPDPNAALREYFRLQTKQVREESLKGYDSLEDWKKGRPELHRQLAEMLGLDPLPERTPLNATVTGTITGNDVIVEKLHFESRPGLYVTANLWRPREQSKPLPAILYVCGHARVKENGISYGNKVHYQHHGAWFARNGYVCLVIDTLGLGEVQGIHHGVYPRAKAPSSTPEDPVYATRWWWYSRGYTPAGVETWNGMRGIDYLQSRPEVDDDRIGVTGRSGGGAYSWFIAAMDERVKVAVPVAGITDLKDHVVNDCIEGHCDCMFFINYYGWDYPMLAAMVAPRALLISNTDNDSIFPLDGVMRVHHFTRHIYDLYDAKKNLGIHVTEGPHADTQELRIGAFVWFDRFLKDRDRVIKDPGDKPYTKEELRVFRELPGDETNTTIDQTFVAKAEVPEVPGSVEAWQSLKESWSARLAETTFAGMPEHRPSPDAELVNTIKNEGTTIREYRVETQAPFELPLYVITRKTHDSSDGFVFRPVDQEQWKAFAVAAGIIEDGEAADEAAVKKWRDRLENGKETLVVFAPRGIGPTAWEASAKERVHIRRRFMLLGQTLPAMRIWDVITAMSVLREQLNLKGRPTLIASGPRATTWALHAAAVLPDLARVQLDGLPATYHDAPELLGVMRVLEMPQALAYVVSETPVTVETEDPQAWEWARSLAEQLDWPEEQLRIVGEK